MSKVSRVISGYLTFEYLLFKSKEDVIIGICEYLAIYISVTIFYFLLLFIYYKILRNYFSTRNISNSNLWQTQDYLKDYSVENKRCNLLNKPVSAMFCFSGFLGFFSVTFVTEV